MIERDFLAWVHGVEVAVQTVERRLDNLEERFDALLNALPPADKLQR